MLAGEVEAMIWRGFVGGELTPPTVRLAIETPGSASGRASGRATLETRETKAVRAAMVNFILAVGRI